jgi:hypothetical protein
MLLFPLMFCLIAAIVSFAGSSYILNHYRARYKKKEIRASFAIGMTMFLLFLTIFFGEDVCKGKAGEAILGGLMIVIVMSGAWFVYRSLRNTESST